MLIVTKNLQRYCRRPKYRPRAIHPMWYVRDTDTGEIVFGPAPLALCHRYQEQQHEELPSRHSK